MILSVGWYSICMELSDEDRRVIVDYLRDAGASEVVLFGSFARGDAGEESDVDVLVEFSESVSLLEVARLERVISEDIGRDVDIVTENGISPHILERVRDREVLKV